MNNKFDYYCLTVRKCASTKTYKQAERVLNDYDYYCNNLKTSQDVTDLTIHYEVKMNMKKQFNIHIHCTLKVPRGSQVFASPKKGWSIRLELCRSLKRWLSYVGKQRISRSDILLFVKRNLNPETPLLKSAPLPEYVPTDNDLEQLEEYIRDSRNCEEYIKKNLPDI